MPAERIWQAAGPLSDSFIVTLAAQVTTLPLLVFAFHRVSPIALVTNLLVLPAQPAVRHHQQVDEARSPYQGSRTC